MAATHEWTNHLINADETGDLPQKYLKNPFLNFYEPENLYRLAQHLELQSGIDIWEPSEQITAQVRPIYIRFGQFIIESVDWIYERTDKNAHL